MNKIILFWEGMEEADIFWPKDKEWILKMPSSASAPSSSPHNISEFYNPGSLESRQRILIGFLIDNEARKMEKMSNSEITEAVVEDLRNMFGYDKVPPPTKVLVTRWGSDEYSLGSYSFQKFGSKKSSRKDLGRPINDCIWFAGEATDTRFPGTTHGALLSGKRMGLAVAWELQ